MAASAMLSIAPWPPTATEALAALGASRNALATSEAIDPNTARGAEPAIVTAGLATLKSVAPSATSPDSPFRSRREIADDEVRKKLGMTTSDANEDELGR